MKFICLAGGIGSGKSTAAELLAQRGAHVLDVDRISRETQLPGQPFYEQIVSRWGPDVVGPDGHLDREALAKLVFGDRDQLAELTAMAAPITAAEIVGRASQWLGTDDIVVCEAAMWIRPMYGAEGLLLVDVDPDVAAQRLVEHRGMTDEEARARIGSQAPRQMRLDGAGYVIDNSGDLGHLEAQLDDAWQWMRSTPDAVPTEQTAPSSG